MLPPRLGRARFVLGAPLMAVVAGCAADEDLGVRTDIFGSVHLEMHRAGNLPTTPFVTTEDVDVRATVTLGECLSAFYDQNSEWAPDGAKGAQVADAWLERLCDRKVFPDVFRCTAMEHVWLPGEGAGGRHRFRIEFHADHPDLERFDVRIGPLAREGLAGCEPVVEVGLDAAEGYAGGELVWHQDPDSQQAAWEGDTDTTVTDSLDAVRVFVSRADP